MIGYANGYERVNKKKIQSEVFEKYVGKRFKNVILFPSTTMNDLRNGYEKKVFDKETRFLFIEKGECYPYKHTKEGKKEEFDFEIEDIGWNQDKKMRKIFFLNELLEFEKEEKAFDTRRCYFHFEELHNMDLEYICNVMNISEFDFCYFDFCGGLTDKLMQWFRYYKDYFKNSELVFTHCIDNLARGNSLTWYKYDAVKPLEYYGLKGEDRDILKGNYETRFYNLKREANNTHILNANNMLLFYEKVFNKKYSDVIFYKDMEGDEWNHRQKMISFRLIKDKGYEGDIKGIDFLKEVNKPENLFKKTYKYWKCNIYDMKEMLSIALMRRYTYIEEDQYEKLKEVIQRYIDMYDMESFKISKRKINFDTKKKILNKTKNIKSYITKDISSQIKLIINPNKRKELEELYKSKKKELEDVEKYIKKELAGQKEREKRFGKMMNFFNDLDKREKVEFLKRMNDVIAFQQ